jgi:hypothetical protein
MTGLISRSKKRELNAMKLNRFRDFKVVKSNDPTSTSNSIVEEITATGQEDITTDDKVKFTVVLPPQKVSPDNEEEDEGEHRSKRQRRRRSWEDDEDNNEDQQRKDKIHFTVTIDSVPKHTKDSKHKSDETSRSTKK